MEHGGRTGAVLTHAVRTVAETGSTNADLLALARAGALEGSWLRAGRQTAGRGRLGREWASPAGNLYASTLVRLRAADAAPATLALAAAVALEEAVAIFLPGRAQLKWPNDLLIDGAKLAGILLERTGDAVVIGFGVNVAHHPELPGRATTSLIAHGASVEAATLLDVLAESFARWLACWRRDRPEPVRQRWLARAHPPGTALSVREPGGAQIDGLFDGLDRDGALLLRLAAGERRVIHAGDVFLVEGA